MSPSVPWVELRLGILLAVLLLGPGTSAIGQPAKEEPPKKQLLTDSEREQLAEAARLNQKAMSLYGQGKAGEAVRLARQALAIRKNVLGENHPDTAQSLTNLGGLLKAQGDYAGAQAYLEQALAIFQKVRGARHPDTATSLNNLGALLKTQGDYAGAQAYFEQALSIFQKALGAQHPVTAVSLNNLGALLKTQGDYAG